MLWCLMVAHTGMYLLLWKWISIVPAGACLFKKTQVKTGGEICDYRCALVLAVCWGDEDREIRVEKYFCACFNECGHFSSSQVLS